MQTKKFELVKYIKYFIFAGIIYGVLKVVPTNKLSKFEIFSLIIVIIFAIFSLECLTVPKVQNENFKETMSDTDSNLFDIDMDVNLDFNKTQNNREQLEPTCKKIDNESLDNIIKKAEQEKLQEEESGLDFNLIEEEIKNRQIEEEIYLDEEITKGKTKEEIAIIIAERKAEIARIRSKNLEKGETDINFSLDEDISEEITKNTPKEEIVRIRAERKAQLEKIRAKKKEEIQKEISTKLGVSNSESSGVNCEVEVAKMRRELEEKILNLKQELVAKNLKSETSPFAKKYMTILIADLLESKIIDRDDVENINAKLISGASTTEEVVASLEKLRSIGKAKKVSKSKEDNNNDMKYSELPPDYYKPIGSDIANQWDNEYTILNTDKWQVPQPRPPVCIGSGQCKVCPSNTDGYTANLKDWDDSRKISNTMINKKWALDQINS